MQNALRKLELARADLQNFMDVAGGGVSPASDAERQAITAAHNAFAELLTARNAMNRAIQANEGGDSASAIGHKNQAALAVSNIWARGHYNMLSRVRFTGHVESHRKDALNSLKAARSAFSGSRNWLPIAVGAAIGTGILLFG